MTNPLRFLPVALLVRPFTPRSVKILTLGGLLGLLSCSEEAPTAAPDATSAGGPGDSAVMTSAADAAQLPEVRYYVVADT